MITQQGEKPSRTTHALGWRYGMVLFLIALLPRLFLVYTSGTRPVWDGIFYAQGAERIAAGLGYSADRMLHGQMVWEPWSHYPVGYSAFLAFFVRLFGASIQTGACVNACVGAFLAVVTWKLACTVLPRHRAYVAGLLVALHPGLVLYSALWMTEPLTSLLLLISFWFANEASYKRLFASAFVLGTASLVRPQAILCLPALVWVAFLPRYSSYKPLWHQATLLLAPLLLATSATLLPILPWTLRNCRVLDRCTLISSNSGWNLAIGALPDTQGRYAPLPGLDPCQHAQGPVEQDRCLGEQAVASIRQHPWPWITGIPGKWAATFHNETFAAGYLHAGSPQDWTSARQRWAQGLTTVCHRGLLVAALGGCVACVGLPQTLRRRGKGVLGVGLVAVASCALYMPWLLALGITLLPWMPSSGRPFCAPTLRLTSLLVGTLFLTHGIFFGEDRYHILVSPVFCLFAAALFWRGTLDRTEDSTRSKILPEPNERPPLSSE